MANIPPSIKLDSNLFSDIDSISWTKPLSPDEKASKIQIDKWNVLFGYIKEGALLLATLVLFSLVIYMSYGYIADPNASVDDKKWSTSIITTTLGALVGYFTGRSQKA